MANIIVAAKIIDAKIRLVIRSAEAAINCLKCVLVAINHIRIVFADDFHIFKQSGWIQNVVMIQQTNIMPGCHFDRCVCIFRNAFVFFQLFVFDALVLSHILAADFLYIRMLLIAAVCQAKLPLGIGLASYRFDHFFQEILGCII